MQNYMISINNSDSIQLIDYNGSEFKYNATIKLLGIDFDTLKTLISNINHITIYLDESPITVSTRYDGFSSIIYLGQLENKDLWQVTFTKTDLLSKLEELEEKVNPIIDIESMTVQEYKDYVLSKLSTECEEDIHAGEIIDISTGDKLFTFKSEDQLNLTNAFNLITQSEGSITYFPYHASGEACSLFPATDIIHIHLTLQSRLIKLTTYCNQLNMYVKTLNTKEKLSKVKYGMELPAEYQAAMEQLMEVSNTISNGLRAKLLASLAETTEE